MRSLPEVKLAFVLHSRPFKENQAILELLVEGEGRLSAVTYKGSKKNTAKTALLQPFRPIKVIIEKDTGLRKLKHIEAAPDLKNSAFLTQGKPLFCGFYLNELLCRLCASDAHFPELYPVYLATIKRLQWSETENPSPLMLERSLRQFEFALLSQLGYGIDLSHTVDTDQSIEPELQYELFQDTGFVFGAHSRNAWLGEDILLLAQFLEGQELTEERQLRAAKSAKLLLRTCLHRHLGDKPLKSRELFRAG